MLCIGVLISDVQISKVPLVLYLQIKFVLMNLVPIKCPSTPGGGALGIVSNMAQLSPHVPLFGIWGWSILLIFSVSLSYPSLHCCFC